MNHGDTITHIKNILLKNRDIRDVAVDCQRLPDCYMSNVSFIASNLECKLVSASFSSLKDSLSKLEIRVNDFLKSNYVTYN